MPTTAAEEMVKAEWMKANAGEVLHFYCIKGYGSEEETYSVGYRLCGIYFMGTVKYTPFTRNKFRIFVDQVGN